MLFLHHGLQGTFVPPCGYWWPLGSCLLTWHLRVSWSVCWCSWLSFGRLRFQVVTSRFRTLSWLADFLPWFFSLTPNPSPLDIGIFLLTSCPWVSIQPSFSPGHGWSTAFSCAHSHSSPAFPHCFKTGWPPICCVPKAGLELLIASPFPQELRLQVYSKTFGLTPPAAPLPPSPLFKKVIVLGLESGLSTCCSCKGCKFSSQKPPGDS